VRSILAWLAILTAVVLGGGALDAASAPQTWPYARVSFYGGPTQPWFQGELMANGEPYDENDPTIAAAPLWPGFSYGPIELGARVVVQPREPIVCDYCPPPWIVLRITDHCPGCGLILPAMWLDLSLGAFQRLAPLSEGMARVSVTVIPQ